MTAVQTPNETPAPHAKPEHVKDTRKPAIERKVDRRVEDSFPASDPTPASPGAD